MWINNKVLLYITESYIQHPMINHNGKEYKKECVCVCVCVCVIESLCRSAEIKTYKSTIYTSVKKKKKNRSSFCQLPCHSQSSYPSAGSKLDCQHVCLPVCRKELSPGKATCLSKGDTWKLSTSLPHLPLTCGVTWSHLAAKQVQNCHLQLGSHVRGNKEEESLKGQAVQSITFCMNILSSGFWCVLELLKALLHFFSSLGSKVLCVSVHSCPTLCDP